MYAEAAIFELYIYIYTCTHTHMLYIYMYIARACMYTTCICADCQDEESEERSLKMMDVQGYDSEAAESEEC